MKEVIYINDITNFTKTLDEFRNGFNDLKNMALKEVFLKHQKIIMKSKKFLKYIII